MLKILILEDEALLMLKYITTLERMGHETVAGTNGLHVLHYWEKMEQYDVLITDARMPRMNGIEVLQFLNARGWKKPTLIHSSSQTGPHGEDLTRTSEAFTFAKFALKTSDNSDVVTFIKELS